MQAILRVIPEVFRVDLSLSQWIRILGRKIV